jgi:mono/diheme cytochrome c family protein
MPVWGPVFHQVEADMDWGNVRIHNLVNFLESIQLDRASSAADMYKQFCSACHGPDLKGTGSVPEPYKAAPDLTTLARRHGGEFPETYVSNVLRNGVVIPAHGLADMPVWGTDSRFADPANPAQATARIAELTNYIKSLQAK